MPCLNSTGESGDKLFRVNRRAAEIGLHEIAAQLRKPPRRRVVPYAEGDNLDRLSGWPTIWNSRLSPSDRG